MSRIRQAIVPFTTVVTLAVFLWGGYYYFWMRHEYLITAYCNCPICINVKGFRDGKFANGKPVHWGAVAADRSIPFGSRVELVPLGLADWWAISHFLGGQKHFTVEDRGGKIRGQHIDIFFSDSRGGHQAALRWGVRRMRIKINGRWAD